MVHGHVMGLAGWCQMMMAWWTSTQLYDSHLGWIRNGLVVIDGLGWTKWKFKWQ